MRLWGNEYDRMEMAGAFGDLGTLIPFLVGYITIVKMDPVGVLVAFGVFKIISGLYFRTPIPIQPMKAIGGAAIAHAASVTPGMVWSSGLVTGVFWLLMGVSGAVTWIEKVTAKPVVRGIMLGLGLSFVVEGLAMMREQPVLAVGGAVVCLALFNNRRLPAMLALLAYGVLASLIQKPELAVELRGLSVHFRLPALTLGKISWRELVSGFVLLALPQVPLTLGNAVIGTVAENNHLFPDRKTTAKQIALDHGIMNLVSASAGGVPMCHGAGGLAGHVRFGARTGGALVILGSLVLAAGLFLGDSVTRLLQLFPRPVLGVILFFAGVELAMVVRDVRLRRDNLFVLLVTAGTAMWNMGVAYLAGMGLYYAIRRRWVTL